MGNAQLNLSSYAQNIFEELKRHIDGLLKIREADLIRLSRVPSVRIIEARDELEKCLEELKEGNLSAYEKQGDRYIIRDIGER